MNEPFTPATYLRLLRRHWLLIVIPLALALIIAVVLSLITPVKYTSTTTLLAPNPQLVWRWDNRVSDVVNLRFDWRAEVIPLIATEAVAQRALDQVQSELSEPMDAATLVASTNVRLGDGSLFYISVKANQPEDAALLTNTMAQALPEVVADLYAGNIDFVEANAEQLPFDDNSFNCITIAFGLRNVTHQDKALQSMYRVLKPGGRLLVLEFSKPVMPGLDKIYDFYSFNILPKLGKLIADDEESYRYLAESIRMHPDQETLKRMMQEAGFENCDYHNFSTGIVALHHGNKL